MTTTMSENKTGLEGVDLGKRFEKAPKLAIIQGVSPEVKQKKANPGQLFVKDWDKTYDAVSFNFLTAKTFYWLMDASGDYEKTVHTREEVSGEYSWRKPEGEDKRQAIKVTAVKIAINRDFASPVEILAKKSALRAWEDLFRLMQDGGAPTYATEYRLEAVGAEDGPHFVPKITAIGPLDGDALAQAKKAWLAANGLTGDGEEVPF